MGLAELYWHLSDKTDIVGENGADLIPTRTAVEQRKMLADRLDQAVRRFAAAKSKQPSIQ